VAVLKIDITGFKLIDSFPFCLSKTRLLRGPQTRPFGVPSKARSQKPKVGGGGGGGGGRPYSFRDNRMSSSRSELSELSVGRINKHKTSDEVKTHIGVTVMRCGFDSKSDGKITKRYLTRLNHQFCRDTSRFSSRRSRYCDPNTYYDKVST